MGATHTLALFKMSHTLSIISPQQWAVLQALNTYRYLTVEQMLNLGLSKNAKSIRDKTLFALRHRKFIQSVKIGSFLPDVHHLTKHGATLLAEIEKTPTIAPLANKRMSFSAFFARHRFAQVDIHIAFRQWVKQRGDAEVVLELQDFTSQQKYPKGKFISATELTTPELPTPIIPDGIFGVQLNTGQSAVYLVEVHRSTQTQAVTEQLIRYFNIIKTGAVQKKFDLQAHPIVCSVHLQQSVMKGVKSRLTKHPEFASLHRNFVFRAMDHLPRGFIDDWQYADNTTARPFPLPNHPQNERQ